MNDKRVAVAFTPHQTGALVLTEARIAGLQIESSALHQLGATSLAEAFKAAASALEKAHEAYVAETQRAIAIAAPGDLAKLVAQ